MTRRAFAFGRLRGAVGEIWPVHPWDQLSYEAQEALLAMGLTRDTWTPGKDTTERFVIGGQTVTVMGSGV